MIFSLLPSCLLKRGPTRCCRILHSDVSRCVSLPPSKNISPEWRPPLTEREQLVISASRFSPLGSRVCLLKWTWDCLSECEADGMIIKQNKHSFAARVVCRWRNRGPQWSVNISLQIFALSGRICICHHVLLSSHLLSPAAPRNHKLTYRWLNIATRLKEPTVSVTKVFLPRRICPLLSSPRHSLNRLHNKQDSLIAWAQPPLMLGLISIRMCTRCDLSVLFKTNSQIIYGV